MRTAKYLIVAVGLLLSCLAPASSFAQAQSAPRPGQVPLAQQAPAIVAPATAPAAQAAATPDLGYILGPEDQITVRVFAAGDIPDKPAQIDNNGVVTLPMIGPVHAGVRRRERPGSPNTLRCSAGNSTSTITNAR